MPMEYKYHGVLPNKGYLLAEWVYTYMHNISPGRRAH